MKCEDEQLANRQKGEAVSGAAGGEAPASCRASGARLDSSQLPMTTETDKERPEIQSIEALANSGGLCARITFPKRRYDAATTAGVEPVVVLLGWLRGTDGHLAKYSSFYNEHGCVTVRVPVKSMPFAPDPKGSLRARRLLALLTHERIAGRPVVFHAFSNGGCMLLAELMLLMQQTQLPEVAKANRTQSSHAAPSEEGEPRRHEQQRIRVVGTIFDSAPSFIRMSNALRALTAHIESSLLRCLGQALVATALVAMLVRRRAAAMLRLGVPPLMLTVLRDAPRAGPELYLYSTADRLIPHQDVANFAAYRRQLGVDVTEVCWNDSEHVSHMPKHSVEYATRCLSFVDGCCGHRSSPAPRSRL